MSNCKDNFLIPLRFGSVSTIQRPRIRAGDVIRIHARASVRIADCYAGWRTNYQEGVRLSDYDIFIADLSAALGPDGFASVTVAALDQRPIVCPNYDELGADLIVDLRGLPADTNGVCYVNVFPQQERYWAI